MSLFLYPTAAGPFDTIAPRQRQRDDRFLFTEEPVPSHRARRCVPFAQGYRPVSTSTQPYFYVTADDDDDDVMDYQVQDLAAALRRQEQQVAYERHMAAQRRQQLELARRQQLERQRRILEQRRREQQQQQEAEQQALVAMAAAAASAWATQVEEQQKRQVEHARRVALARHHQQRAQLEAERRELARKAAYFAHFSSLVDIDDQFFADLVEPEAGQGTTPASQQDAKQSAAVSDPQAKTAEGAQPADDVMAYDDPADVVPTSPTAPSSTPQSSSVAKNLEIAAEDATPAENTSTQQQPQEQLVFTYPLPADAAQRASVSASNIDVAYDKQTHSLVVKGLWPTHAGLPETSTNERGRRRTRSPKRPRVSDVDETTGEEIERPAGDTAHATSNRDDDDFEHVDAASSAGSSTSSTQHSMPSAAPEPVLVPLPAGADMSRLRADLTDDGLRIWI